jgi:hypothetical protein
VNSLKKSIRQPSPRGAVESPDVLIGYDNEMTVDGIAGGCRRPSSQSRKGLMGPSIRRQDPDFCVRQRRSTQGTAPFSAAESSTAGRYACSMATRPHGLLDAARRAAAAHCGAYARGSVVGRALCGIGDIDIEIE